MFLRSIILTFILFIIIHQNHAQTLIGWEMSGVRGYGISPFMPQLINGNVSAAWLTKGAGITKLSAANAAANGWGGNGLTETSLANAVTGNDFITFSITANEGYSMALTQIPAYNIRRSNTGPTSGQWQYRIANGAFVNIGNVINWGAVTTAAGNLQTAINLSTINELQAVAGGTTVTFRLLIWGGTSNQGNWYINNIVGHDLALIGTITNVSNVTISIGELSAASYTISSCNTTQQGLVSISTTGIFETNNIFTVELSSYTGGFMQALRIGQLQGTTGGSIVFTLPENTVSANQYRIRIRSSNPAYVSDPSNPITITQNDDYCAEIGDYRSRSSNNWTSNNTWQVYQYNNITKSRTWVDCLAGDFPQSAINNVYIRNGNVVTLTASLFSVRNLIIEQGGKLFRNGTATNHYLNLGGDLVCNGTFGNGTTSDAISLNIQEGIHTIKGSGSMDCWRIRLSNEFDNNITGGDAILIIDRDVNLRWPALTDGTNAIYNGLSGDSEFNVIINPDVTVSIVSQNASVGIDGVNANVGYEAQNRGGGYQVFGKLLCAGHLLIGSNNNTPTYFKVEAGGLVRCRYLDFGTNNVVNGGSFELNSGAILEIAGFGSNNRTWLNTTTGSIAFNINTGSRIKYTGNLIQVVNPLFTYSELEIDKNTEYVQLSSNLVVKDKLIMTRGGIKTDQHQLIIGTSTTDKGLVEYTAGYVVGTMKRWFAGTNTGNNTSLFPIYSEDERKSFVNIEFTTAPIRGGSLTVAFIEEGMGDKGLPIVVPETGACDGFNIVNTSGNGYWEIDDHDGLTGGIYNMKLEGVGHGIITDVCELAILKRVNGGDWILASEQVSASGSTVNPIISITNGSGWSNFGFGGGPANPLPVTLRFFEALYNQILDNVTVHWLTETERNNDFFVVQYSKDAVMWSDIAVIKGNGTIKQQQSYSYEDTEYYSVGQNYYRLKQVDFDGKTEYSVIRKVVLIDNKLVTNVYPNPANDKVFVVLNEEALYEIDIMTINGVLIHQSSGVAENNILEIDISALHKGLYILTSKTNNIVESFKLVVE